MTILGICLIIIGIITAGLGIIETHTINPMNSDFMSFLLSGIILATIGICVISEIPTYGKVMAVWLSALAAVVYTWGMDMDLPIKLISAVVVFGLAAWITTKLL